jgi:hypothetical protein
MAPNSATLPDLGRFTCNDFGLRGSIITIYLSLFLFSMKLLFILLTFLLLCPNLSQAQAPGSEYWDTRFAPCGLNDYVTSAVYADGKYYLSGSFTEAQGKPISQPAVWDGNRWSTLDTGIKGTIEDMEIFGRDLYICGKIDTGTGTLVNAIGRWNIDEAKWHFINLGNEFWTTTINHLEVDSQDIYFGSTTTNSIFGLCRWNKQEQKLYILPYMSISDMVLSKNYLYVSSAGNVVAWDKKNENMKGIDTVGGLLYIYGTGSSISDIAVAGNDSLFIAGNLSVSDSIRASKGIALWDGVSWHPVGSGFTSTDTRIYLAYEEGTLYAAGNITSDDDSSIKNFAVWRGSAWQSLDSSLGKLYIQWPPQISVLNGSLCLYGYFNYNIGSTYKLTYDKPILRWNGADWITIDSGSCHGLNGPSDAVLVEGNDIIVCGNFLKAGGVPAGNIAKWNGSNWEAVSKEPLGSYDNIDDPGVSFAHIFRYKGDIYVSGIFNVIKNNDTIFRLTKLDALGQWGSVKGLQFNGASGYGINTTTEFKGELYVGGSVEYDNQFSYPFLAKLQDDSLVMLTQDTLHYRSSGSRGGWITSLVTDGEKLYIGGAFTHIGNVEYNCLAAWDGKEFSRLEENDRAGVTAEKDYKLLVTDLVIEDSLLIITGYFDSISGVSSRNLSLAQWNMKHNRWHEFAKMSNYASIELRSPAYYNDQILFGAAPNDQYLGKVPLALGVDGKVRFFSGGIVVGYSSSYGELPVRDMVVTKDNTLVCVGSIPKVGGGVPSENFALYKAPPLSVKREVENDMVGSLFISPNPASDIISVRYRKNSQEKSIFRIVDALGRTVISETDDSPVVGERTISISLRTLPAGMYHCIYTNGIDRYTSSVVVR